MRFPSARRVGREITTVLACALAAASLPAFAQNPGPVDPGDGERGKLFPMADAYSLLPGDTLTIVAPGVMANDAIPTEVGTPTVAVASGPAHGSLMLAADGGFEYTPAKGFVGMDSFRYRLSLGARGGEAEVTLAVFAPSNLALSVVASQPFVEIGSPITFTFTLANGGTTAANDVELVVIPPALAQAGGAGFWPGNGRCQPDNDGKWRCPMGTLPAGATLQVPFTFVPKAGGSVDITGMVTTSDPDTNANDNAASAHAVAGRLSAQPGQVVARATWVDSGMDSGTNDEVVLLNEWPLGVQYEVAVSDPNLRNVVPEWVTVTPASGVLRPSSAGTMTVHLSAQGAPGLKRAVLYLMQDSPSRLGAVPVSFTVAFLDVPAGRGDDPYVHALAGAKVTSGCGPGIFCPDVPLTRAGASVWLLLSREGNGYFPSPAQGIFSDVSPDRRDASFVEELARRGVAGGCDADRFCPDDPLARADAAVMVMRMLQGVRFRPRGTPEPMFKDLTDDPRRAWVEEAAMRGFFAACDPEGMLFCPDEGITRGDAAVAMVKAFGLPLF